MARDIPRLGEGLKDASIGVLFDRCQKELKIGASRGVNKIIIEDLLECAETHIENLGPYRKVSTGSPPASNPSNAEIIQAVVEYLVIRDIDIKLALQQSQRQFGAFYSNSSLDEVIEEIGSSMDSNHSNNLWMQMAGLVHRLAATGILRNVKSKHKVKGLLKKMAEYALGYEEMSNAEATGQEV